MDLPLADFVLFVVFGSSLLVLLFTFVSRTLHARAEARSVAKRVVCRLCLHAFVDQGHDQLVDCPHCGAANERGRRLG
jgi:hypothetical protein